MLWRACDDLYRDTRADAQGHPGAGQLPPSAGCGREARPLDTPTVLQCAEYLQQEGVGRQERGDQVCVEPRDPLRRPIWERYAAAEIYPRDDSLGDLLHDQHDILVVVLDLRDCTRRSRLARVAQVGDCDRPSLPLS